MKSIKTNKISTKAVEGFVAEHPIATTVIGLIGVGLAAYGIYLMLQKPNSSSYSNQPQQTGGEQTITPTITPTSSPSSSQSQLSPLSLNPTTNPSGFGVSAGFVGGNLTNEPYFNYESSSKVTENYKEEDYTYAPVTTTTTTKSLNYSPELQYSPSTSLSTSGIASGIGSTNYSGTSGFLNTAGNSVSSLWKDITSPFKSLNGQTSYAPATTQPIIPDMNYINRNNVDNFNASQPTKTQTVKKPASNLATSVAWDSLEATNPLIMATTSAAGLLKGFKF